jgi:predicted dehydrogenase
MASTVRVGLVGCGGMGRHHLDVLRALPDFEIVGLCDVSEEARARSGEEYSVQGLYEDPGAMCDAEGLDIVTVATQTRHHHDPTVAALERGVSVICEKPIALDLGEADNMVGAASASGAKLSIHQQNHMHPGIRKAVELVADGAVGDVMVVRGRNKAGRKSGNEFMEMGTHITDMMMRFAGPPEWCAGTVMYEGRLAEPGDVMHAQEMSPGDRDSGLVAGARASGRYGHAEGVFGEILFLDYAKTNNLNYGVDILGTDGQLAVRTSGDLNDSVWHLSRPMEGHPSQAGDWRTIDLSNVGVENPIIAMYRGMAKALEDGGQPPCDGVTGRWGFEMIMGIYASHVANGARVDLPLADRTHPLEGWAS